MNFLKAAFLLVASALIALASPGVMLAQGVDAANAAASAGRQLAGVSRRLFRQASQFAHPDHAAEREESGAWPGPSRPTRRCQSSPRRCWWMAFCTSPFRTTSGLSMPAPATRSGTTPTRRTKGSTSGIAASACTRDISSSCLPTRTLSPSTPKMEPCAGT